MCTYSTVPGFCYSCQPIYRRQITHHHFILRYWTCRFSSPMNGSCKVAGIVFLIGSPSSRLGLRCCTCAWPSRIERLSPVSPWFVFLSAVAIVVIRRESKVQGLLTMWSLINSARITQRANFQSANSSLIENGCLL